MLGEEPHEIPVPGMEPDDDPAVDEAVGDEGEQKPDGAEDDA